MTFAFLVRDWLIRGVWEGINQSQARFVKDIMNSEKCYVIYILHIIDIQNILLQYFTFLMYLHQMVSLIICSDLLIDNFMTKVYQNESEHMIFYNGDHPFILAPIFDLLLCSKIKNGAHRSYTFFLR